MNLFDMKVIDVLPIVVGILFVSKVDFVNQEGEVGKNWSYGFPVGLEKVLGIISVICGAINFRFLIRLTSLKMKTRWIALKLIMDDFSFRFISETLAAALGTLMAGHWWIRLNALSRCVGRPEGKACEYEPDWMVEIQRNLLSTVYPISKHTHGTYLEFFDGCNPPPFNTFAYFVHALPALGYTISQGLVTFFIYQGGDFGAGGKSDYCPNEDPSPPPSPERECEDFSPKKKSDGGCPCNSNESNSGGDLSEELPPEVKKKLDETLEKKSKNQKEQKGKETGKDEDNEDVCSLNNLLDDKNEWHSSVKIVNLCKTCKEKST